MKKKSLAGVVLTIMLLLVTNSATAAESTGVVQRAMSQEAGDTKAANHSEFVETLKDISEAEKEQLIKAYRRLDVLETQTDEIYGVKKKVTEQEREQLAALECEKSKLYESIAGIERKVQKANSIESVDCDSLRGLTKSEKFVLRESYQHIERLYEEIERIEANIEPIERKISACRTDH